MDCLAFTIFASSLANASLVLQLQLAGYSGYAGLAMLV